jgi:hypothetical protein
VVDGWGSGFELGAWYGVGGGQADSTDFVHIRQLVPQNICLIILHHVSSSQVTCSNDSLWLSQKFKKKNLRS